MSKCCDNFFGKNEYKVKLFKLYLNGIDITITKNDILNEDCEWKTPTNSLNYSIIGRKILKDYFFIFDSENMRIGIGPHYSVHAYDASLAIKLIFGISGAIILLSMIVLSLIRNNKEILSIIIEYVFPAIGLLI